MHHWISITVAAQSEIITNTDNQDTDVPIISPIVLAGKLRLEEIEEGEDVLAYNADTRTGAVLYDSYFTLNGTIYRIKQVTVTSTTFSLRITQGGEETDEKEVLGNHFLVFKKGFSAIGYINPVSFITDSDTNTVSSVLLTAANGLKKDDFLSLVTFEITTERPIVNRYPEEIKPLPEITHTRTEGSITLNLTDYFKDHENTRLSFYTSLDGACCVVHHEVEGGVLTLTPIGVGATTIEVGITDAAGYTILRYIDVEILPGTTPPSQDTTPPIIQNNDKTIEVVSAEEPIITISVDHQAQAGENLRVIFNGLDSCKELSADEITGTSADTRPTGLVYKGTLTGGTTEEGTYGFQQSEQIGNLLPTTLELVGTVYHITEVFLDDTSIVLHIAAAAEEENEEGEAAAEETETEYPDMSGYYFVLEDTHGTMIGYTDMKNAEMNEGVLTVPIDIDSSLRSKKWFDGTHNTILKIARVEPNKLRNIPPQDYTIAIKGSAGIYNSCTVTVADPSDNKADPAALSIFTILQKEEEEESTVHAPVVPEQETPKEPYSLIGEQRKKEEIQRVVEIKDLAVYLANPDISTSDVQKVILGRRSHVPEVQSLQIFLNLTGYTVAEEGWGSRGMETEYFGPATERALKAMQKANNVPVTGELDTATQLAILKIAYTEVKKVLQRDR